MRKIFIYSLFLVIPFLSPAQDCDNMHGLFIEGVKMEYTHYDKEGKVQMTRTQKAIRVFKSADTLVALHDTRYYNKKGKETSHVIFPIKCHAGNIYIDMRSVIQPQEQTQESPDIKIEMSGTDQMFPSNMKVGQTLPDADFGLKMKLGGIQLLDSKWLIKNRKVEAEESITTPAGTYKCMRISYDFEYNLLGAHTLKTTYWHSPSVGMVKVVNYDKKGIEKYRTELTKFTK